MSFGSVMLLVLQLHQLFVIPSCSFAYICHHKAGETLGDLYSLGVPAKWKFMKIFTNHSEVISIFKYLVYQISAVINLPLFARCSLL